MGHAFHQLFYHFAWATHFTYRVDPPRLPTRITEDHQRGSEESRRLADPPQCHARPRASSVRLPPTLAVSEFIGQVKGAACHRVNEEIHPSFKLKWQEGYGALTLREDELEKVSRYIDNQETHHQLGKLSALLERTEGDEGPADTVFRPLKGAEGKRKNGLMASCPGVKRLG